MIIQGDNHPTIIELDEDPSSLAIHVGLYDHKGHLLKNWTESDVTIEQISSERFTLSCPWSQQETASLPSGQVEWAVKGIDSQGMMVFWQTMIDTVYDRPDRRVMMS